MITANDSKYLGDNINVTYFRFTMIYYYHKELQSLLVGWRFLENTNAVEMFFGKNAGKAREILRSLDDNCRRVWLESTEIDGLINGS